ncbi:MAG: (2Fe-2S) ferredoxin domain-containing protein [Gammaproteobacteria bacterium]|nr:(2Fe-2S) ferredoxin domain-containing protein [Gammaproteobacteria bacterium]
MAYYRRHLFICVNERDTDRVCCAQRGSVAVRAHAKRRLKELGLSGPGKFRANACGCTDRCEEGPIAVVYPDAVWYSYEDAEDMDEIIDRHLVGGEPVERLRLPDS